MWMSLKWLKYLSSALCIKAQIQAPSLWRAVQWRSSAVPRCTARSWEPSSPPCSSEEQMWAIRMQWVTCSQLTLSGVILWSIYSICTDFARYRYLLETSRCGEALCCAWGGVKVTFFLVICFITSKCSQTDRMISCWVTETFIKDICFLSVKGSKVQQCHSL